MPGRKNSSKKRKTAVAWTVGSIDPKEQLQAEMRSLGFDGDFFTRNLEASVERNMRRGKGPRRTRYVYYCNWAYALLKKEVGPGDAEFSFPDVVLAFLRHIAPGDIKGEIREDALEVTMEQFCEALEIPRI